MWVFSRKVCGGGGRWRGEVEKEGEEEEGEEEEEDGEEEEEDGEEEETQTEANQHKKTESQLSLLPSWTTIISFSLAPGRALIQREAITTTAEYLGWVKIQACVPSASALIILTTNQEEDIRTQCFPHEDVRPGKQGQLAHGSMVRTWQSWHPSLGWPGFGMK